MMKKLLLMIAAVLTGMLTVQAAVKIDRIEPTNWYVGMKNPSVQLMVYGEGIRDAEVTSPSTAWCALIRLTTYSYI